MRFQDVGGAAPDREVQLDVEETEAGPSSVFFRPVGDLVAGKVKGIRIPRSDGVATEGYDAESSLDGGARMLAVCSRRGLVCVVPPDRRGFWLYKFGQLVQTLQSDDPESKPDGLFVASDQSAVLQISATDDEGMLAVVCPRHIAFHSFAQLESGVAATACEPVKVLELVQGERKLRHFEWQPGLTTPYKFLAISSDNVLHLMNGTGSVLTKSDVVTASWSPSGALIARAPANSDGLIISDADLEVSVLVSLQPRNDKEHEDLAIDSVVWLSQTALLTVCMYDGEEAAISFVVILGEKSLEVERILKLDEDTMCIALDGEGAPEGTGPYLHFASLQNEWKLSVVAHRKSVGDCAINLISGSNADGPKFLAVEVVQGVYEDSDSLRLALPLRSDKDDGDDFIVGLQVCLAENGVKVKDPRKESYTDMPGFFPILLVQSLSGHLFLFSLATLKLEHQQTVLRAHTPDPRHVECFCDDIDRLLGDGEGDGATTHATKSPDDEARDGEGTSGAGSQSDRGAPLATASKLPPPPVFASGSEDDFDDDEENEEEEEEKVEEIEGASTQPAMGAGVVNLAQGFTSLIPTFSKATATPAKDNQAPQAAPTSNTAKSAFTMPSQKSPLGTFGVKEGSGAKSKIGSASKPFRNEKAERLLAFRVPNMTPAVDKMQDAFLNALLDTDELVSTLSVRLSHASELDGLRSFGDVQRSSEKMKAEIAEIAKSLDRMRTVSETLLKKMKTVESRAQNISLRYKNPDALYNLSEESAESKLREISSTLFSLQETMKDVTEFLDSNTSHRQSKLNGSHGTPASHSVYRIYGTINAQSALSKQQKMKLGELKDMLENLLEQRKLKRRTHALHRTPDTSLSGKMDNGFDKEYESATTSPWQSKQKDTLLSSILDAVERTSGASSGGVRVTRLNKAISEGKGVSGVTSGKGSLPLDKPVDEAPSSMPSFSPTSQGLGAGLSFGANKTPVPFTARGQQQIAQGAAANDFTNDDSKSASKAASNSSKPFTFGFGGSSMPPMPSMDQLKTAQSTMSSFMKEDAGAPKPKQRETKPPAYTKPSGGSGSSMPPMPSMSQLQTAQATMNAFMKKGPVTKTPAQETKAPTAPAAAKSLGGGAPMPPMPSLSQMKTAQATMSSFMKKDAVVSKPKEGATKTLAAAKPPSSSGGGAPMPPMPSMGQSKTAQATMNSFMKKDPITKPPAQETTGKAQAAPVTATPSSSGGSSMPPMPSMSQLKAAQATMNAFMKKGPVTKTPAQETKAPTAPAAAKPSASIGGGAPMPPMPSLNQMKTAQATMSSFMKKGPVSKTPAQETKAPAAAGAAKPSSTSGGGAPMPPMPSLSQMKTAQATMKSFMKKDAVVSKPKEEEVKASNGSASGFGGSPASAATNVGNVAASFGNAFSSFTQRKPESTPAFNFASMPSAGATAAAPSGMHSPSFLPGSNAFSAASSVIPGTASQASAPSFGAASSPSQPAFASSTATPTQSAFGQPTAFGQSASIGQASTFGQSSSFGQPTPFGQSASAFGQAAKFGQPAAFGQASAFGQPSTFGQSASALGQSASTSPFGQPTSFGQSSSFGQQARFGQSATIGQPSALSAVASSPFGSAATNVTNTPFSAFGGGGGLGSGQAAGGGLGGVGSSPFSPFGGAGSMPAYGGFGQSQAPGGFGGGGFGQSSPAFNSANAQAWQPRR